MIRFGLCCIFRKAPIKFRTTTAAAVTGLSASACMEKLSGLCLHNARTLIDALETVKSLGIGAFRILSPLFPLYTHPLAGYALAELPDAAAVETALDRAGAFARESDIRLGFHPDQFILLSSPRPHVVENSMAELAYQAMLSDRIGAEVINIHGGGVYGDKAAALDRLRRNFARLPDNVKTRLTLENDDVSYTVRDLDPVCRDLEIPLVYDVHHHRCNPDGLSVGEATEISVRSWDRVGREPYFHVSSPKNGWGKGNPRPHADYIDVADFPEEWLRLDCAMDVEAKAKELAVVKLMMELGVGKHA